MVDGADGDALALGQRDHVHELAFRIVLGALFHEHALNMERHFGDGRVLILAELAVAVLRDRAGAMHILDTRLANPFLVVKAVL